MFTRRVTGTEAEDRFARSLRAYAHNLLTGTRLRRLERNMVRQLEDIEIVRQMVRSFLPADQQDVDREQLELEAMRAALRTYIRRRGGRARKPVAPAAPVCTNLRLVADLVGLSRDERAVLQFIITVHATRDLGELSSVFGDLCGHDAVEIIGAATGVAAGAVHDAFLPTSRLAGSGLLGLDSNSEYELRQKIDLKPGLVDLILAPNLDRQKVIERFLDPTDPPTLGWDDFAAVDKSARLAQELLAAAALRGARGVNLLLYGPTGTGKTELARFLARELGVGLFAIGRADNEGQSATAHERLTSLMLAQRLLSPGEGVLLFDELEDLFEWQYHPFGGTRGVAMMSKQWFNDALERNPIPTIWITNQTQGIDPAFLRRFSFAIEFTPFGPGQRERVLARHLGDEHTLAPLDVRAVAERFTVSPAQLRSAVATARTVASDGRASRATLEQLLAPMQRLLTGVDPTKSAAFDAGRYRLDVVSTSADLEAIAARLETWQPEAGQGVSLCLYGRPGTGKSEFVRYLAHRMGRPVHCVRASDLLSMWLGQTEQQIAEAFRQAEAEGAVLLLDEVDSFLRDRATSQMRWEVTQTNELLQQIENSHCVVACTTNLWKELDEAVLRRFVFKIEFRWLGTTQACALFDTVFADLLDEPLDETAATRVRGELGALSNLAPGDFAVVARRLRALGAKVAFGRLLAELRDECRVKRAARGRIGF